MPGLFEPGSAIVWYYYKPILNGSHYSFRSGLRPLKKNVWNTTAREKTRIQREPLGECCERMSTRTCNTQEKNPLE